MMSHKQLLPLLVLLGVLPTVAPLGFAQSPAPPLNFGNNFFVTGDYIVAGAYNMTTKFKTINGVSYAVGTINVPDAQPRAFKPGTGEQVPQGGQVVAALLYWQTVEKVGVAPGARIWPEWVFQTAVIAGGPAAPGYAISGTNLTGSNTVSWSSGGCSGGSTGKLLRTYRADVGGALPVDGNGNPIANGSFEVRLPSVGQLNPSYLGRNSCRYLSNSCRRRRAKHSAELDCHLRRRLLLKATTQLTMTQQMQGFYDAAAQPCLSTDSHRWEWPEQ